MFNVVELIRATPSHERIFTAAYIAESCATWNEAEAWIRARQKLFASSGHDPFLQSWWAYGRLCDDDRYCWTIARGSAASQYGINHGLQSAEELEITLLLERLHALCQCSAISQRSGSRNLQE